MRSTRAGRIDQRSIDQHKAHLGLLEGLLEHAPEQETRLKKFGHHVRATVAQLSEDVQWFVDTQIIDSRFGVLTGLKEDDSWRTTELNVSLDPTGVVQSIAYGHEIRAAREAQSLGLDDEVDEVAATNDDGLA